MSKMGTFQGLLIQLLSNVTKERGFFSVLASLVIVHSHETASVILSIA